MDKTWSQRVKELETRGWSLKAIGDVIGLTSQSVSDIKCERTKAPTGMAAVLLHNLHSTGAKPPASERAA